MDYRISYTGGFATTSILVTVTGDTFAMLETGPGTRHKDVRWTATRAELEVLASDYPAGRSAAVLEGELAAC